MQWADRGERKHDTRDYFDEEAVNNAEQIVGICSEEEARQVKHTEQIMGETAADCWGISSDEKARQVKHTEPQLGERNHDSGRLLRD